MNKEEQIKLRGVGAIISEVICKTYLDNEPSFLDENKILWKSVNGEWIGKRSVWTLDWKSCWLGDVDIDNVKSWWCGTDVDYNELFKNKLETK